MGEKAVRTKKSRLKRLVIIMASIIFALVVILAFFLISNAVAHGMARVVPDYDMDVDGLNAVLDRGMDEWTDDDYDFIYRQTGLTKTYFDGITSLNKTFVLNCQTDLFYEGEPEHDSEFIFSSHDYFPDKYFSMVTLKPGDVLISASVHTMGWRNGHAAIAIGPNTTIQAITVGTNSRIQQTLWFRRASNFMVLRPKISEEQAEQIAAWAEENLVDVPYSLFTGIFNAKDQTDNVQTTHCSHLVWQAYMAFGYDIDSTGGPVVSPRNIANCDLFEVVQVNGFDLDKLWS